MDGNGLEPEAYQLDPATELSFMKAQLEVMTKALEERIKTLTQDVSWTLSELGHDHWQECHTTDEGCYLCAGYLELREKYKNA